MKCRGAAALLRELAVTDVVADAETLAFVEERLGHRRRHRRLEEPPIDLGLILHPPARKKRGERELRKNDEARALGVRLTHERDQALDDDFTRVGEMDGPNLGGGDLQMSGHGSLLQVIIGDK